MDLKENLKIVNEKCMENIEKASYNNGTEIMNCIDKITKLNDFIRELVYDSCLLEMGKEIISDLTNAVIFSSGGFYRVAYQSTRSAMELGFGLIRFIDDKYSYILWTKGKYDINWSKIMSEDEGVFVYLRVLSVDEDDQFDQMKEESKRIYRLCSEYVHGKYNFMQQLKNPLLDFNEKELQDFIDILGKTIDLLIKIYKVRCVVNG